MKNDERKAIRLAVCLATALALPCGARMETSVQPVVTSGALLSSGTNVTICGIVDFSLANDGEIALTANLCGTGVNSTNREGVIQYQRPGNLSLLARTGDPRSRGVHKLHHLPWRPEHK